MVARWAHNSKVVGSSPTPATIKQAEKPAFYFKSNNRKKTHKMKRKFVTRPHYCIPDILIPILNKKNFPENRIGETVTFIEDNAVDIRDKDKQKACTEIFMKNKDKIYLCEQSEKNNIKTSYYCGWNSAFNTVAVIIITEYDDKYSMLLSEENGGETLVPLMCIDNNLNIWK